MAPGDLRLLPDPGSQPRAAPPHPEGPGQPPFTFRSAASASTFQLCFLPSCPTPASHFLLPPRGLPHPPAPPLLQSRLVLRPAGPREAATGRPRSIPGRGWGGGAGGALSQLPARPPGLASTSEQSHWDRKATPAGRPVALTSLRLAVRPAPASTGLVTFPGWGSCLCRDFFLLPRLVFFFYLPQVMGCVGLRCASLYCVLQAEALRVCLLSFSSLQSPHQAARGRSDKCGSACTQGPPSCIHPMSGPWTPLFQLAHFPEEETKAPRPRREPEAGHGELPLPLSPRRRMRRGPHVLQEQGSTQLHSHTRVAAQPGLVPCRGHRQAPVQGWAAG